MRAGRRRWSRCCSLARYREQVEYLNQRVTQLIDRVTAGNPTATVIIMSDHGSGSEFDATTRGGEVEERYGIVRGPDSRA